MFAARWTTATTWTTGLARAPLFACVARVRHLASPAVPPIPRDRALVLMPRTWPKRLWRRLSGWTQGRKHRGGASPMGGSIPAPSTSSTPSPRVGYEFQRVGTREGIGRIAANLKRPLPGRGMAHHNYLIGHNTSPDRNKTNPPRLTALTLQNQPGRPLSRGNQH